MKQSSFKVFITIVFILGSLYLGECHLGSRASLRNLQGVSAWQSGVSYSVGMQVSYGGSQYQCLQAHTSLVGWEPPSAPALWSLTQAGQSQPPVNNSTSNNTTTTTNTTTTSAGAWQVGVLYTQGTIVTYNGVSYNCLLTHTSQSDWAPPNVLSLWQPLAITCPTKPGVPTQLTGGSTSTSISINWTASALPSGCASLWYVITANGNMIGNSTVTSYTISGLSPSQQYQIGVSSADSAGVSAPAMLTVTTAVNPCTIAPPAPGGLSASSVKPYGFTLQWYAAAPAQIGCTIVSYNIYQNGVLKGNSTSTSFNVNGLAASTVYSFTVQAVGLGGISVQSSPIQVMTTAAPPPSARVFAPYMDMGLSNNNLASISAASGIQKFSMAFVIGSGCQANWFGAYNIPGDTTIGPIIKQFGPQNVIVSFGGAIGVELAQACSTAAATQAQYQAVIDAYNVTQLDFDIEGAAIAMPDVIDRRNKALAGLKARNPGLVISYTLPTFPTGLTQDGVNLLANAVANGVQVDVVNVMAMDYGGGFAPNTMGTHAINAATNTLSQMASLGMTNSKVGITPMIGLNDVAPENFSLDDAQMLLSFAQSNPNVARLAMWSVGRDNGGCPGSVSYACSGLQQSTYQFANIFKNFS